MSWKYEYEAALPPVPSPVTPSGPASSGATELLRSGCWFVRVEPRFYDDIAKHMGYVVHYEGTLRFEWVARSRQLRASGDLYLRPDEWKGDELVTIPGFEAETEIPFFPRRSYRYYVRAVGATLDVDEQRIELVLESYRLDPKSREWGEPVRLVALLNRPEQKDGVGNTRAEPEHHGLLKNEHGTPVADVKIAWVSPYLRRAIVELQRDGDAKRFPGPVEVRGETKDLVGVFGDVGWLLEPDPNADVIPRAAKGYWTQAEMHRHMLEWRSNANLDEHWRYHVLCIGRTRQKLEFGFGVMYDRGGIDSNGVPREGVAIGFGGMFPRDATYGNAAGKKLGEVAESYLRATVHELGHAMGLSHNYDTDGFMQATAAIAASGNGTFPDNIDWSFHPDDVVRLKHLPDIWMRPGGLPFLHDFGYEVTPLEDLTVEAENFSLRICPSSVCLPLGAPLRLTLELRNEGVKPIPVPDGIGLSSGNVSGWVEAPGSSKNRFASAFRYASFAKCNLEPGQSKLHSMTLVRGSLGALLPGPGFYRVSAHLEYAVAGTKDRMGGRLRASGESDVLVDGAVNSAHARAAFALLRDPDIVLPLIFRSKSGVDPIVGGVRTLEAALANSVLRPHYAAISAKWRAERGDLQGAAELIQGDTELTVSEVGRLVAFLEAAGGEVPVTPEMMRMVAELRRRIGSFAEHATWQGPIAPLVERAERLTALFCEAADTGGRRAREPK